MLKSANFMNKRKQTIYLDSTIPNYVLNKEYLEKQKASIRLLKAIQKKKIIGFISPVTMDEILDATEPRRTKMVKLLKKTILFQNTPEAEKLAENYIKHQIFTKTNRDDARHVGYAVYYQIDIIVSYNFTHIVRLKTIQKLQGVNLLLGFKTPEIRSPEGLYG